MKTALILIDIQMDYFKGGRNELVNPEKGLLHAKEALALFRAQNLPVIHVQHISQQPNATFFLPDSEGIKIHEEISPQAEEKVVIKHFPDSFFETDLQEYLQKNEIKRLVIGGMMSHMCIDTGVRRAKHLGYEVVLLEDTCATKDLVWDGEKLPAQTVQKVFMASLAGVFATVIPTKELAELL